MDIEKKSWIESEQWKFLKQWQEDRERIFDQLNNDILTTLKNAVKDFNNSDKK